jgi:hypothetical protein
MSSVSVNGETTLLSAWELMLLLQGTIHGNTSD